MKNRPDLGLPLLILGRSATNRWTRSKNSSARLAQDSNKTMNFDTEKCSKTNDEDEPLEKLLLELNPFLCKIFTLKELLKATSDFSSGSALAFIPLIYYTVRFYMSLGVSLKNKHSPSANFIAEGGCSYVYRGCLPNKKEVAIKVLKQYKEACADFASELEITRSLSHRYIIPLVGACCEDGRLILVFDFAAGGSLNGILHDGSPNRSPLTWKVRYRVALAVAEALNYIHNNCRRPVIHRDVTSSNILLSSDSQPKLADFGRATRSESPSASDVVGTFGYIAPEYFMQGRMSEKIDIYSYGVVLLELLTGRKALSCRGCESLVQWATPLLEAGDPRYFLDPWLEGKANSAEVQRVILASLLCTKRSPRLRPKSSQILKLLRREQSVRSWLNGYVNDIVTYDELDNSMFYASAIRHQEFPLVGLAKGR